MSRLIDADALLAEYDRVHVGPPGGARKLIEDAPTIEPSAQEECIPIEWINKLITRLDSYDNTFAQLSAANIRAMLNKWEKEGRKHDIP